MDVLSAIEVISAAIKCFKEGIELISKATEHYEKYRKTSLPEKKDKVTFQSNVIHVNAGQPSGKIWNPSGFVSLYISNQLYYSELQQSRLQQNYCIKINPFYDTQNLNQLPSVILEHPRDSLIVIRNNYTDNYLTLQFEMLNIIPGNDSLCYRMSCRVKCDIALNDYMKITNALLDDNVTEIMKAYEKYQQPVFISTDRLELEARILQEKGYSHISYKKIDMGYGLDLPLGLKQLVIGIPDEYPRKAPTVVLIYNNTFEEIEFENDWDSFLTIGHIVTAIKNKEQTLC